MAQSQNGPIIPVDANGTPIPEVKLDTLAISVTPTFQKLLDAQTFEVKNNVLTLTFDNGSTHEVTFKKIVAPRKADDYNGMLRDGDKIKLTYLMRAIQSGMEGVTLPELLSDDTIAVQKLIPTVAKPDSEKVILKKELDTIKADKANMMSLLLKMTKGESLTPDEAAYLAILSAT